ncbi:MAG: HTH domain-containing protein, partial [candidate division WOR-3 bacterium]
MAKATFIEAAYQILKERGIPLTSGEITKIALERNLIETSGKTPSATMAAGFYRDIKEKGNNSLFVKIERGKFGLREWQKMVPRENLFRKGTFKYAAYEVLRSKNKPMSIQEITEFAKQRNLFVSAGKT